MTTLARHLAKINDPLPRFRPLPSFAPARRHKFAHLYGSRTWRRLREIVLRTEPLCRTCGKIAEEVDHIVKHNGDHGLFHDQSNLQPICRKCHRVKTRLGM